MLNEVMNYLIRPETRWIRSLNIPPYANIDIFAAPTEDFFERIPAISIAIHNLIHINIRLKCLQYSTRSRIKT
jgi:hypothetical protein